MPVSPDQLPDNLYHQEDIDQPTLRSPSIWFFFFALCFAGGLAFASQYFPFTTEITDLPSQGLKQTPEDMRMTFRLLGGVLFASGIAGIPFSVWYSQQPKSLRLRPLLGMCFVLIALGPVLGVYSLGDSYAFYDFALWVKDFYDVEPLRPYFYETGGIALGLTFLSFTGFYLGLSGQKFQVSDAHGSAGWGDGSWFAEGKPDTFLGKMLSQASEHGVPIGWRDNKMLYDRVGEHVYVQAPTGSGKSVGFVIPTLLMHPGSVLAIDIKRELYQVTSARRYEVNGSVHRLDPFSKKVETAKYNPLDFVKTRGPDADTAKDDADLIASMIVVETGKENNPFFIRSAQQLVSGLILYVASYDREGDRASSRHLGRVRSLLMQDDDKLQELCGDMGTVWSDTGKAEVQGRCLPIFGKHGEKVSSFVTRLVAETGNQFAKMNDKEFTAVVSTAREQTKFLSSPRIQNAMTETTFHFSDMRTNPRGASIYLCLPDDRLDTYFRWLRLMIASAQIEITRLSPSEINFDEKALFMLEEFPRLSKMKEIDKGVSLHRSYGIQYVLICQSLNQINEVYGQEMASNIRENCQLKIALAPDSMESAREVSEMCGSTTVATETGSKNKSRSKGGGGGGSNRGVSTSIQETERPLVTPDEARRTPSDWAFVFKRSERPLVIPRPNYVTDDLFDGLADPHPQYSTEEEFEAARQRRINRGYETPIGSSDEEDAAPDPLSTSGDGSPPDGSTGDAVLQHSPEKTSGRTEDASGSELDPFEEEMNEIDISDSPSEGLIDMGGPSPEEVQRQAASSRIPTEDHRPDPLGDLEDTEQSLSDSDASEDPSQEASQEASQDASQDAVDETQERDAPTRSRSSRSRSRSGQSR